MIAPFGDDIVTDFSGFATDRIILAAGLSVKSGLGTTTVTIWDGMTDFGTIHASNLHEWTGRDFD